MRANVLRVDDRNKITLGDLLDGHKRVRLYKNDRGAFLLQPTAEILDAALWLFQNKEAFDVVQRGLNDTLEGKIEKLDLDELCGAPLNCLKFF